MGYVFFLVCTMYVCSLLCSLVVFPVSCWEFSREFLSRGGVKSAREGGRGGGGVRLRKSDAKRISLAWDAAFTFPSPSSSRFLSRP